MSADEIHVPAFDRTLMTCRVYWMGACGDFGDGVWYWVETDETGNDFGTPVGPFGTAIAAGSDAREAIIRRSAAPSEQSR
jgi:hypothetical protein